ncbi:OPT superfamily oligopeptide transporter [Teratosphaeria nubilosa]|uniref:OPT superfamily oligopeptide transporter n=1 Tax=Teratosphaeria nubilosa TaxID=161662 RepID=A0A6G1LJV6_9PEZI|nr:OPT superfamily oligopeptide transporter [Teratosphaeria nubilosa]
MAGIEIPAAQTSLDSTNVKDEKHATTYEVGEHDVDSGSTETIRPEEIVIPDEQAAFIDPRLKDYPVPLVAKTVDLHNDATEPILTFRFWFLSTFWVVIGCGVSGFYYFKPYDVSLTSYAVQLLSWGMGDACARWLPKKQYNTFGYKWSLNPGPWNAKEHALIVVAYWGSCYTAYGLGPLSALELYYGRKISAGWSILYMLTSQMIGYGFAGIYRDILVQPPKMYYPGVLPNVALFNAMHKNPTVTKRSLTFFAYVAIATFCWQWFPELIIPLLASLPLICWMGHGNPIAYVLGSGTYGFGLLDLTLDWNYINGTLQPMYTPLWAFGNQAGGIIFACWFLYPILYYTNTFGSQTFPAMSSNTFDKDGNPYNISLVMTPDYQLNQTAMDNYSQPHWSISYVFYFFWGFASSTGAMLYAVLWYGKDCYNIFMSSWKGKGIDDYNDPYLKIMSVHKRVPHWWYFALLAVCFALSLGTIYGGNFDLPWWGFIGMCFVSWVFTFPNGIQWAIANQQVGMSFLAEVISGSLFHGNPQAVLTSLTFSRQILEQNLNLISDYKFGFYMKVPEKEMFIAQVYGTLIGPFINYGTMRFVLDHIEGAKLKGDVPSVAWEALTTRNFYSISVLWGVIGPKNFFGSGSPYSWLYYGFLVGPAVVLLSFGVQRLKPHWQVEYYFNAPLIFYGITNFPRYGMTNFFTAFLVSLFFMGYMNRYHPVWWRKYHYLLGVGLDCGAQIMATVMTFCINLPNVSFPAWWGFNETFPDRCFPPNANLPAAMQMSADS